MRAQKYSHRCFAFFQKAGTTRSLFTSLKSCKNCIVGLKPDTPDRISCIAKETKQIYVYQLYANKYITKKNNSVAHGKFLFTFPV